MTKTHAELKECFHCGCWNTYTNKEAEFLEELKKDAKFYIERKEGYEYYYVHCWEQILEKIEQFEAEQKGQPND